MGMTSMTLSRLGCSFLFLLAFNASAATLLQYDHGDSSDQEQLVMELINRARANPPAEAQRLGLSSITEGMPDPSLVIVRPPLAMNKKLLTVARAHSTDMYTRAYFAHTNPDGKSPFNRIADGGYSSVSAGENIATASNLNGAGLEDLLMIDEGLTGRGHRVNLLDARNGTIFREVGIGYYSGATTNSKGFKNFITQDFGTVENSTSFMVGVVYKDTNGNNFYDAGEGLGGVTVTPDNGTHFAITSSSGGYAFPVGASGMVTITASGGALTGNVVKIATLAGVNVKMDFKASEAAGGGGGGLAVVPVITSALSATGTLGTAFSYTITASNTPTSFSAELLPDGLALDPATGILSGTPSSVGTANVTLSAGNAAGKGSATLILTIVPAGSSGVDDPALFVSSTAVDTDTDGFPDELETALSGSLDSTPFGGSTVTAQTLNVAKLSIKLNFTTPQNDSIKLSGLLPLTEGFVLAQQIVVLNVGGNVVPYTLTEKGKARTQNGDTFKISAKKVNKVVVNQDAKFSAAIVKRTLSSALADEGLLPAISKLRVQRKVPVVILFNTQLFSVDVQQFYTAKKMRTGKTTLK